MRGVARGVRGGVAGRNDTRLFASDLDTQAAAKELGPLGVSRKGGGAARDDQ